MTSALRRPRSLGSAGLRGSVALEGLPCFRALLVLGVSDSLGVLAGFKMSRVEVVGLFLARTVDLQCICLVNMSFPAVARLGRCDLGLADVS